MTLSRTQILVKILRESPSYRFTTREIVVESLRRYPEAFIEKRQNPRYKTEKDLIQQLVAEIGGSILDSAKRQHPNIKSQDRPRPRVIYWEPNPAKKEQTALPAAKAIEQAKAAPKLTVSEHDSYPMLISFLSTSLSLYCQRIDEKTSKNSHGNGGNHWLHPDVVALEPMDKHWNDAVKDCVRLGGGRAVRLWSFEVKKQLTRSNVRQSFFQTVSNSSWANYGYLVATGVNPDVESELQMLAGLHGIGVLLLNTESVANSHVLIPARERLDVDWGSVNRIVLENKDFKRFIEQVGIYNQTGRLTESVWNQ